jgi:UrcA family protein
MKQVFKSVALALTAALSLSSTALAEGSRTDLRVAMSDLDLSQPADAAAFNARVDAAVTAWCNDNLQVYSGQRGAGARVSCRKEAHREVQQSIPKAQKEALKVAAARAAVLQVASR